MAFQKLKKVNSKELLMANISTVVKDVFKCEEVLLLSVLYILALACAHGLRKNSKFQFFIPWPRSKQTCQEGPEDLGEKSSLVQYLKIYIQAL